MVLTEDSPVSRSELVHELTKANVECRPIVTGNFVKNVDVLKYFDYEVYGDLTNAEYIDKHGLFVGNHQTDMSKELDYLKDVVDNIFSNN